VASLAAYFVSLALARVREDQERHRSLRLSRPPRRRSPPWRRVGGAPCAAAQRPPWLATLRQPPRGDNPATPAWVEPGRPALRFLRDFVRTAPAAAAGGAYPGGACSAMKTARRLNLKVSLNRPDQDGTPEQQQEVISRAAEASPRVGGPGLRGRQNCRLPRESIRLRATEEVQLSITARYDWREGRCAD